MASTTVCDPGALQVERKKDGSRELLQDLVVRVPIGDEDEEIKVPKHFSTDYSSLPPGTRWVVNWDRVDLAGRCPRLPLPRRGV